MLDDLMTPSYHNEDNNAEASQTVGLWCSHQQQGGDLLSLFIPDLVLCYYS
jgi:hypothetical protein